MKRQEKTTVIHESAKVCDTIIFSGGKIGYQVEVTTENLAKMIPFTMQDICFEDNIHVSS